jgi:NadR type nicotinamide-nucleotide adenylyltransferase
MKRGLVVGKFAPLHRGHELVIRTALAACDEVFVLSYARPEPPGCSAERRARWLAALFPETRRLVLGPETPMPLDSDPDDVHRAFIAELCRGFAGGAIDAVFTSEAYGPGFAAALSRELGRPVAHVAVDSDRRAAPISASAIRADVHAHRDFLAPVVYASFVARVAILGGESSGKSTLARALADHFQTEHVPEYARELWVAKAGALEFDDLLHIAQQQVEHETRAAERARRFVFCDTTPLTTWFYSLDLFGRADPRLEALAARPYDVTVLAAPDFTFVQDGTRRDPSFRDHGHAFHLAELARRNVRPVLAEGSLERRIAHVASCLDRSRDERRASVQG